jgi:hypothetical protein
MLYLCLNLFSQIIVLQNYLDNGCLFYYKKLAILPGLFNLATMAFLTSKLYQLNQALVGGHLARHNYLSKLNVE